VAINKPAARLRIPKSNGRVGLRRAIVGKRALTSVRCQRRGNLNSRD
jgi:hypothetical protein